MNLSPAGHTTEQIMNAQEWLRRAHTNAKTARLIVEQKNPELLVEAVTQVQQACEKATKAVMLANGMAYGEVAGMGHNSIGAFVNLIARLMCASQLTEDLSRLLVREETTGTVREITKLVFPGKKNKGNLDRVLYAWKQIFPASSENLGNKALEVEQWQRLTRAFDPKVVELLIAFHETFKYKLREYINEIPSEYVDPRPLLAKEVKVETWVFNPSYAGLPRRFQGQESDAPIDPRLENLAQQLVNDSVEQIFSHIDQKHWPEKLNIKEVLLHISNWLAALGWLFLCATVTTPHAVSSRYPAEEFQSVTVKGSQHYSDRLGVVACIDPLAVHTEEAIRNLIRHYRQIEEGYRQMLR